MWAPAGQAPEGGWAWRERSGIPSGHQEPRRALHCLLTGFFQAHDCHEYGVGGGSGRTKEVERDKAKGPGLSQAEGEREDWVPRVREEDTREFPVASEPASIWAC